MQRQPLRQGKQNIKGLHHILIVFLITAAEGFLAVTPPASKHEPWKTSTYRNGPRDSNLRVSPVINTAPPPNLDGLSVAIVGAGPAGLLLAHQLAQAACQVHVFEQRSRYTPSDRAYALGVGIRGRVALQQAKLWDRVVRPIGYESDRFILHTPIAGIQFTLRDARSSAEPSLLLYQSDLCQVLADALEEDHSETVRLKFDCGVTGVDLHSNSITTSDGITQSYDLIVGCDGVNSVIRQSMQLTFGPVFQSNQTLLPGLFKVAQLPEMPPKLDPTAVQLILPQSGSTTAFFEPVSNGACLLFAGSNETDVVLQKYDSPIETNTIKIIQESLVKRFPILEGVLLDLVAQQLAVAKQGRASKVVCNVYHAGTTCLVGDAAHATGGVSGQGLNSALTDTSVLMDSLVAKYDANDKVATLEAALLEYSQRAVPEGIALSDLSFSGRGNIFTSVRDFVFKGRFGIGQPLLQTQLTTSQKPFATIRREREDYFVETFPSDEEWKARIQYLTSRMP